MTLAAESPGKREPKGQALTGVGHVPLCHVNVSKSEDRSGTLKLPINFDEPRLNEVSDTAERTKGRTASGETRQSRFKARPPSKANEAIELTDVAETEVKRSDQGESSPRESDSLSEPPANIRGSEMLESSHEEKHNRFKTRKRQSSLLVSQIIRRTVRNGSGPVLIINKTELNNANDQLQILRTRIKKWRAESGKRALLISSAVQNEGKSFVALNLAAVCASSRTPVLLIDANLRRPSLHRALGVALSNGLGDYLNGVGGFASCLHQTGVSGLTLIPAGDFKGSAIRGFADSRISDFLEAARALQPSHMIVIDSPAALAAAEVQILAEVVDATLLVTAANQTPRAAVLQVANFLKAVPLLGVVLNRFEAPFSTLRASRCVSN
jgi:protein-tyrosine kinase